MPSDDDAFNEASIFYDSGATCINDKEQFAESLCLGSKPVKILITKVGGVREEVARKVYKIPVCTVDGKLVYSIEAVGILQISNEVKKLTKLCSHVWPWGE